MLETFETRTQVPGGLGYILDIVVTQINLINPQVEDNTKLKIDAKFLTNNITITTSRINVSEFKGGNGLEFQEKPLKLKDKLFKNPLECQVYYDNQVVGTATFLWPDSIINNIAGDCGRELMHCQEADINNNKQKVGQMEILARLQIKCEEFKPKDILQPKHRSCNPADNVINPNDVLFMVGANKNASVVCADMDMDLITASQSTSSANATCLDLSPFRHINGKTVTNTDILKSIDEANCCRLKQSSNQCKSLMDSVLNQSNRRSQKNILNRESKAEKSTSVSRIISCSSSVTNDSCQCISDVFTSGSKATICQKDNFKENHVKRFCPLCHENVSWVPKFSACPKCGYRSIPFDIEKPYDYKLTAERILQEFINKGKQDEEIHVDKCTMIKEQKSPKSRCTCKDGKICAHCRIKKLCEDIFQTSHNADEKCGKCESNTSELYNICKTSSPDCRPYLMKVFEELRKIYDIKKPKKKDENGNKSKKFATDDENCFKPELNKEMEYKTEKHIANRNQNNEKNLEKEREKFLINNFQKKESCRGEIGNIQKTESLIHPDCQKPNIAPPIIEPQTTETILNDKKGFLLDIIIVRLDFPYKIVNDASKMLVEAKFIGSNITITSSRINVLDFKPQPILEFVENPIKLKEDLSKNPLRLKVTEESAVLGYGSFKWPEEFLFNLLESSGEITQTFETELKECDGTKTGTLHAIIRLQPKCEEYKEDDSPDGKCRNANKEINPNDVLFMVGEDKKSCCCSEVGLIPASTSDEDLQPKCLDLSYYQAVNSRLVDNTDILNSLNPLNKNFKTVTKHYQRLIDAIKSKKTSNTCRKENEKLLYTLSSGSRLNINIHPTSSDSFYCNLNDTAFRANNNKQIVHIEKPPDLIVNEPISIKYCPLCKEDMSFLPKLAACPNCCYKPIPCFEEKTYNEEQNAEQILKSFQDKLQTNENPTSSTNLAEKSTCRCTCKYGSNKPCAHCRIRKLCEDIFQSSLPVSKAENDCEKKSSDMHCPSSADDRPFLTKVFSELIDLYDIEKPKMKRFEPDKYCEKMLNKEPCKKKKAPIKKEITAETQKCVEPEEDVKTYKCRKRRKRSIKPATNLAAKSKFYDYKLIQHRLSTHIGHKTCINGFAGRKNVPSHMGWLWNVNNFGKWKPGYIRKPIKELMKYFLKDFPADTLLVSQYSYRNKSRNSNNFPPLLVPQQKPTLHIHKRDGEYIVTMRPLKPVAMLKEAADPYENMKPIQFRIIKNPQIQELRDLKKCLKEMGFKKCTCHRPIIYCYCRSFLDKKRLEYECNKECSKRDLDTCCDTLILSDTSDSEAEFDFGITPPVGVMKPERLRKNNFVNVGCQYSELDWNPVPLFPKPPNKYMQMYQCAVGERKGKSAVKGEENRSGGVARTQVGPRRGLGVKSSSGGKNVVAGVKGRGEIAVGAKTAGPKAMVDGKGFAGGIRDGLTEGRGGGGGDGFLVGKGISKGSGKNGIKTEMDVIEITNRKVDMLKYTMKVQKMMSKMSPAEIALKSNK
ncbi:uncharacterized protein ACRADG_007583 isoform 2-T2 [Cochliomyia hominivorax]